MDIAAWMEEATEALPTGKRERRLLLRGIISEVNAYRMANGGFETTPGREPGQYYFATREDGEDLLRVVTMDGMVVEHRVAEFFERRRRGG